MFDLDQTNICQTVQYFVMFVFFIYNFSCVTHVAPQDTTYGSTSARAQGGHYKSLIPKEAITPQPLTMDAAITDKIKTEMTILSMLSTNEAIVIPSLARLEELRVAAPELIKSGICNLLYITIYLAHHQSSEAGKLTLTW